MSPPRTGVGSFISLRAAPGRWTARTSGACRAGALLMSMVVAAVAPQALLRAGEGERPATPPAADALHLYLESFALDSQARELLERPGGWDEARQGLALRVLARLSLAPPEFVAEWRRSSLTEDAVAATPVDRLVHVVGRATFVAPVQLPVAQVEVTGRQSVDLVRIVSASGTIFDVLADAVPQAWPRWHPIDEPASFDGLPLASGSGPVPSPQAADGVAWPTAQASRLLAATRVAWHPPGLPGAAGMDMGLLDSVLDGQKLTAGDADAFYALLAASGKVGQGEIAAAAGPPGPIIPLIDPEAKWFPSHRGEPFSIEGIALRATRIEIDDPLRRLQTGIDHYWELFVFVATPLISVGGKAQDRYPVVCCLRSLPDGMPRGPSISEPVRVAGFALKSYAYPLRGPDGTDVRREAPLLVGGDVTARGAAPRQGAGPLDWGLTGLAAVVAAGVVAAAWMGIRESRRNAAKRRSELPSRWEPPAGLP